MKNNMKFSAIMRLVEHIHALIFNCKNVCFKTNTLNQTVSKLSFKQALNVCNSTHTHTHTHTQARSLNLT